MTLTNAFSSNNIISNSSTNIISVRSAYLLEILCCFKHLLNKDE